MMSATMSELAVETNDSGNRRRGTRIKPKEPKKAPSEKFDGKARESVWGFSFISPFFIIFFIFGLIPILYSVRLSMYHWGNDPLDPSHTFVGAQNFCCGEFSLVKDALFWTAVRNTFSIFFFSTIPQMVLALGIASILRNPRLRGRLFWQTMLLVPNITSVVAVAYVFGSFFAVKHGLVNQILVHVFGYSGPDGVGVDWQENALAGQIAISSMIAWRWVGYNSLIFLASMNAIPKDLYESSSLDGATRWQQFRFVTMPQLRNTITFMLVMGTIGGMSVFAEPSIYSGSPLGGDHSQFLTLTMYLFYYAYTVGNYGYASAIGIGIAVIVMVFSLTNFVLTRRIASEDSK